MYTLFATSGDAIVLIAVCIIRSPPGGSLPAASPEMWSERRGPAVPASAAVDRKGPQRRPRRSAHDNRPPTPFVIRNHGERPSDEIRLRPRRARDQPYSIGG